MRSRELHAGWKDLVDGFFGTRHPGVVQKRLKGRTRYVARYLRRGRAQRRSRKGKR